MGNLNSLFIYLTRFFKKPGNLLRSRSSAIGHGAVWERGSAITGDWGEAITGPRGLAVSDFEGLSKAGDKGIVLTGITGQASAGKKGVILVKFYDAQAERERIAIGYPGEGGLEPNTFYRTNKYGKFVRATEDARKDWENIQETHEQI